MSNYLERIGEEAESAQDYTNQLEVQNADLEKKIAILEAKLEEAQKYANRYHALESYGVDNWSGYDDACKEWRIDEDE